MPTAGWGSSHIPGKYSYTFLGTQFVQGGPSVPLEFTQDFTIHFMVLPYTLNGVIMFKGDISQNPEDPTQNSSFLIEAVGGILRVWIHGLSGGVPKTLRFDSSSNFLNTQIKKCVSITWNNTSKTISLYVNAVPETINIHSGIGFVPPASLDSVTPATGEKIYLVNAFGKTTLSASFYRVTLFSYAMSSSEVFSYYLSVADLNPPIPPETILFTSNRSGIFNVYTMNGDGQDQQLLISDGLDLTSPRWSNDGSKLAVCRTYVGNQPWVINTSMNTTYGFNRDVLAFDADGSNQVLVTSGSLSNLLCNSPAFQDANDTLLFTSSGTVVGGPISPRLKLYKYQLGISSLTSLQFFSGNDCLWVDASSDGLKTFMYLDTNPGDDNWLFSGDSVGNLNPTQIEKNDSSLNLPYSPYHNLRVNKQGTRIGYSKLDSTGGYYQVYIRNDSGAGLQQITAGAQHSIFGCFSPDGTKILYNQQLGGVWQIIRANVDGSNAVNISNTGWDERVGDWK